MDFVNKIAKNKVKLLLIAIIVLVVIFVVSMIIFFTDNSINPTYGHRLDGIEDVKINKSESNKMVEEIKKESSVKDVSYNVKGKIVNVIITVSKDTSVKSAKELASKVTGCYEKDQVSFYDFQVFIKSEDENSKSFPIIGYKKASSNSFSFTKNRGDK